MFCESNHWINRDNRDYIIVKCLSLYKPNGFDFCFVSTAPSQVMAIRQENASQNSVILFWHEPAQPNGVILEYDIKYYEKVGQ